MRRLLVASALLVVAPACFGDDAAGTHPAELSPTPTTELTIAYKADAFNHSAPLTLTCNPVSGDVTNPAAACRLLAAHPDRFVGLPSAWACFGGEHRWSVTISGELDGQPVANTYDMCAYPQARAWTDLGGTDLIGVVPARSPEALAGPKNQQREWRFRSRVLPAHSVGA